VTSWNRRHWTYVAAFAVSTAIAQLIADVLERMK
jgi:hypothetical protein